MESQDSIVCRMASTLFAANVHDDRHLVDAAERIFRTAIPGLGDGCPDFTKAAEWLIVQCNKVGLSLDEIALRNIIDLSAIACPDAPGDGPTRTKKKRGRPKADLETVQREAELAADWVKARDSDVYKADFAKQENMKKADLDRLLDRVAARKKRSDK